MDTYTRRERERDLFVCCLCVLMLGGDGLVQHEGDLSINRDDCRFGVCGVVCGHMVHSLLASDASVHRSGLSLSGLRFKRPHTHAHRESHAWVHASIHSSIVVKSD